MERSLLCGFGKIYRPRPVKCCAFDSKSIACVASGTIWGSFLGLISFVSFIFSAGTTHCRPEKSISLHSACRIGPGLQNVKAENANVARYRSSLIFVNAAHTLPDTFFCRQRCEVRFYAGGQSPTQVATRGGRNELHGNAIAKNLRTYSKDTLDNLFCPTILNFFDQP